MAEKFGEKKDKSAAEMRKINKPLMERKRRERINNCLNQLKMFLMETTKKDSSYYSKLEKADILELTVKYLKSLQRQQLAVAMVSDPKVASKYTAGYSQCASEVTRYLGKLDGFSPEVQNRLLTHLTGCIQKVTATAAVAQSSAHAQLQGQSSLFSMMTSSSSSTPTATVTHAQSRPDSPEVPTISSPSPPLPVAPSATTTLPGGQTVYFGNVHQQNQQQQQQQQQTQQNVPVLPVQLIPAKLPSGDMVFLMANTQPTVPMATTNFVTSPVSIQMPTGSSSSNSSNNNNPLPAGGSSSTGVSANASNNFSVPVSLSQFTTGSATIGLPGMFPSGSVPSTSVAVVPPNVHECKPSPSSLPTDLSMKSSSSATLSSTSSSSSSAASSAASAIGTKPSFLFRLSPTTSSPDLSPVAHVAPSAPLLTIPEVKPEVSSSVGMSLLSAAAEARRRSEDENNNVMDARVSCSDVTGRATSPDDATQHRASSKEEAAQGDAQMDNGDQQPGPSGLGPMWRPW